MSGIYHLFDSPNRDGLPVPSMPVALRLSTLAAVMQAIKDPRRVVGIDETPQMTDNNGVGPKPKALGVRCARRRLVDDSSRAWRAAQRAARLWSESSRVEITKLANFEVARESLEMVPRRSPGAGASRLSREGPVLPRSRAAGELCTALRSGDRSAGGGKIERKRE